MYLIMICVLLPQFIYTVDLFNKARPDKTICEFYNGKAIYSEDGYSYIFQNNYYWVANPLNEMPGLIEPAQEVSNKWPEVVGKIKGIFVAPGEQSSILKTIFVVGDKWISYEKGNKVLEGTTRLWPGFAGLDVTVMFNVKYGSPMVYVLHNDNKEYILYDFLTLSRPKRVRAGYTDISTDNVLFLQDNYIPGDGMGPNLKGLIDVRGVLTYKNAVVFIGTDSYCIIDLITRSNYKICTPKKSVSTLFGCPLAFNQKGTTTPYNNNFDVTTIMTPIDSTDSPMQPVVEIENHNKIITDKDPQSFKSFMAMPLVIIVVVIGISCFILVAVIIFGLKGHSKAKKPKGAINYINQSKPVKNKLKK